MNHVVSVSGRRLSICGQSVVANGIDSDTIQLSLDSEWDGLVVVITIGDGDDRVMYSWEGDPVRIPAALIKSPGFLPVSVSGYDGAKRVTTAYDPKLIRVIPSGVVPGDDPYPDEPDLLSQLLEAAKNANDTASRLMEMAESGEFDGKDGKDGVTYTAGHAISIDGDTISVEMADGVSSDNTLPISSADVYTIVGNINSILNTI